MPIRRKITWVCLVVLAAVIKVFSYYPAAVEKYYSRGLYLFTARLQRFLFGWLPFSLGDILYFVVAVIILYRLIRLIRQLVRRQAPKGWWLIMLRRMAFILLWVYVLFNGLWGLNYNRLGIAEQLRLDVRPYSTAELNELTKIILGQLNDLDSLSRLHRVQLAHTSSLRAGDDVSKITSLVNEMSHKDVYGLGYTLGMKGHLALENSLRTLFELETLLLISKMLIHLQMHALMILELIL